MELDSKGLGRLQRLPDPRQVWPVESADFTPWLAENIDVLADELGTTLTVLGTEVPVGDFRLDIRAKSSDGRTVIIENQLGRTDHGHLGQLLMYASGLDASMVVWVAHEFRDEHRSAIDWLNEKTDVDIAFFGIHLGIVQIDPQGPLAPVFDVVARPNDWQKSVKDAGTPAGGTTPINEVRQDFFADVLADVSSQNPLIRLPARGRDNWLSFASGPFGYWSISQIKDGRVRVEAYLDTSDKNLNEELFDRFHTDAADWERAAGVDLDWERLDEKRACRIASYFVPCDLQDARQKEDAANWATQTLIKMFRALNQRLREEARRVRHSDDSD